MKISDRQLDIINSMNNEQAVREWKLKPTVQKVRVQNLESPIKTSDECTICGKPNPRGGNHYQCLYDEAGI